VGVTAKTGIFEFMAVRLYRVSGGKPSLLLILLASLDIVLSAFLDNVTVRALHFPLSHSFSHTNLKSPCAEQTMLLLAPVAIQLCEAVGRDPRPYLMSLALFGNVGGAPHAHWLPRHSFPPTNLKSPCAETGTMTMIGDPPNIIIGAPHSHFLPYHSFSHTNLKSPCVEQATC